jgi:hypothetical protein
MNKAFTRRAIIIGAGTVAVIGVAAVEGPRLLRPRHAPSPYDDLFDKLDDRDACAQIGEPLLAGYTAFDAENVAKDLRLRLKHKSLAEVVQKDAETGHVAEAGGWVIPETLAQLCALAAKAG